MTRTAASVPSLLTNPLSKQFEIPIPIALAWRWNRTCDTA